MNSRSSALRASIGPAVNASVVGSKRWVLLESGRLMASDELPPITSALPSARPIATCPVRATGESARRRIR